MRVELTKKFRFEAAHRLPHVPPGHKCERLHGHSYQIEVVVAGEVDEHAGWLIDFDDVAKAWAPLHAQLDHYYLNDVDGLANPTSEVLARWIWEKLSATLPILSAIVVHETCTASATYRGAA